MMRRATAATAAAILVALTLTGCYSQQGEPKDIEPNTSTSTYSEEIVNLSDGRQLLCVHYDGGHMNDDSISCDWAGAK
jgi:predicted small secreted protein